MGRGFSAAARQVHIYNAVITQNSKGVHALRGDVDPPVRRSGAGEKDLLAFNEGPVTRLQRLIVFRQMGRLWA